MIVVDRSTTAIPRSSNGSRGHRTLRSRMATPLEHAPRRLPPQRQHDGICATPHEGTANCGNTSRKRPRQAQGPVQDHRFQRHEPKTAIER